jgi:hypothetical protein
MCTKGVWLNQNGMRDPYWRVGFHILRDYVISQHSVSVLHSPSSSVAHHNSSGFYLVHIDSSVMSRVIDLVTSYVSFLSKKMRVHGALPSAA